MTETEFWSLVDRSDEHGCWPWVGKRSPQGYGNVSVGHSKTEGAHRMSYRFAKGPIPRGMVIRHTCDNPSCVNPAHLLVGTYSDNVNDARVRGRWTPPAKKTHCKRGHEFTPENTYERIYPSPKTGKPYAFRYCRACQALERAKNGHKRRHGGY